MPACWRVQLLLGRSVISAAFSRRQTLTLSLFTTAAIAIVAVGGITDIGTAREVIDATPTRIRTTADTAPILTMDTARRSLSHSAAVATSMAAATSVGTVSMEAVAVAGSF